VVAPLLKPGSHWYRDGSALRGFDFRTPEACRRANERLFTARAPVDTRGRELMERVLLRGMLKPPAWLGTNFFPYAGATRHDVLVASNSALVPVMRAFQMRRAPDRATSLTSKGIEYRYLEVFRRACALSQQRICLEDLQRAISCFSPDRSRYWWPRAVAEPMKLQLEGCMNVVFDCAEGAVFAHKSGRWEDPWFNVTCRNYLR
jgi:hypothetical protein